MHIKTSLFQRKIPVNYMAILDAVIDGGKLSAGYLFFCFISCGIATLGLLLNSPAVIIGAMLISPLMGPIVMQGFSFATFNIQLLKHGTIAILYGFLVSIITSFLIVYFSPISDITPEILARTNPNLFDLLVAILSGIAGGYTYVKQKGSAIVGVAIATALMPPVAVIGFGLATTNFQIMKGSSLLFITNLIAISISVFGVARFYGFKFTYEKKVTIFQTIISIILIIILAIPLSISLKDIAYQSYVTKFIKKQIYEYFKEEKAVINNFDISFSNDGIKVNSVVITNHYLKKAHEDVSRNVKEKISSLADLNITQVAITQDKAKEEIVKNVITPNAPDANKEQIIITALKKGIENVATIKIKKIAINTETKEVIIIPEKRKNLSFQELMDEEILIQESNKDWKITLLPFVTAIPKIYFTKKSSKIEDEEEKKLNSIIWALKKLDVYKVKLIGHSSIKGDENKNSNLAMARAEEVSKILNKNQIEAEISKNANETNNINSEQKNGYKEFQSVEITVLN